MVLEKIRGVENVPTVNISNPYDFRRPVTKSERLIGRDRELERIERCVETTCQGNPVHLALIGERAAGKTSLLNIAAVNAREKGLLVVKVDLDEGVVATPVHFFGAVFEEAIGSLTAAQVLTDTDQKLITWRHQVYQGQLDVLPSDEILLFGGIAAGQLHGSIPSDISPFVLKHDFEQIAELAKNAEMNGVLLLLDEGDLLGTKAEIFQKLRNVLQENSSWMLIAAGTQSMFSTMSDVFSPIPRQFERITVSGLQDHYAVLSCMRRPLRDLPLKASFSHSVVEDVMALTHGRPYEINLVSHFIWEDIYEPEAKLLEFKLTKRVLDNVVAELRGLSRDVEVREVDRIRDLDEQDFEDLADVVPFQKMTVRQAALTKLLPWNYEPSELETAEVSLVRQLETLSELGVIRRDGDRFRLAGDEFVEVYLKYALALHGREHGHSRGYGGLTFAQAVMDAFVPIAFDTTDRRWGDSHTLRMRTSAEIGQARPRSLGTLFRSDVENGDVPAISRSTPLGIPMWILPVEPGEVTQTRPNIDANHVAVGISLQVGVELIEVLKLVEGGSRDAPSIDEQLRSWAVDYAPILAKFDSRVEEIVAVDVPSHLLKEIQRFTEASTNMYQDAMWEAFQEGRYKDATDIVQKAVSALEPYAGKSSGKAKNRSEKYAYGDALNRLGFLTLLSGDAIEARTFIERALVVDGQEKAIRNFNLGRCYWAIGDWPSAQKRFEMAIREWPDNDCYLMAGINLPTEILTASAMVTSVESSWGARFCEAHLIVTKIRQGKATISELEGLVAGGPEDAPAPAVLLRMVAWEMFSAGDLTGARSALESALLGHPEDENLATEVSYFGESEGERV